VDKVSAENRKTNNNCAKVGSSKPGFSCLYRDLIMEVCTAWDFLYRHMWNASHQEIHSNGGRTRVMI
jgi:hypothetical protein